MDEGLLNDLLECSVCLERLDTSSRVLPCQHTFCLKCLKVIVESHKELRCPECRVLVETKVEELPPNVLLMRILEGMRNSAPRKVLNAAQRTSRSGHSQVQQTSQQAVRDVKQLLPHARAMYDFISKEPSDLSFKKGETIILQKKLDPYWYIGECSGRTGMFPSTYVQIIVPLAVPTALCKALYDFRMSAPDEEGCLAFDKGAIITVHRRVDENWAEGRIDQRVGIFPIAFAEFNQAARQLINCTPLTRPVPPIPDQSRPGNADHRHHAQHSHRYQQMTLSTPTTVQGNYQNMPTMSQSHPNYHAQMLVQQPSMLVPQTMSAISQAVLVSSTPRTIMEPNHTKNSLDLIHFTNIHNKSHQTTVGLQSISRIGENYDRLRAVKFDAFNTTPVHKATDTSYQNVRYHDGRTVRNNDSITAANFNSSNMSSDSSSSMNTASVGVSCTTTPNTSSPNTSTCESNEPSLPSSPDNNTERNATVVSTGDVTHTETEAEADTSRNSLGNSSRELVRDNSNVSGGDTSRGLVGDISRGSGDTSRGLVSSLNESSTATNTSLNVSLPPSDSPKLNVPSQSQNEQLEGANNGNVDTRLDTPCSSKTTTAGRSSDPETLLNFGLGLQAAMSPSHGKDANYTSSHRTQRTEQKQNHHHREKRHSLTPSTHLQGGHNAQNSHEPLNVSNTRRHSAEIVATSLLDQAPQERDRERDRDRERERERERRRRRSRSTERSLPATYVAMYPYRPQKPDELELKKGGVYTVTERCRDGWFKGWSERSQRCGVFPGNYVVPAHLSAHRNNYEKTSGPSSLCTIVPTSLGPSAAPTGPSPAPPPDAPPRARSPLPNVQTLGYPWSSAFQPPQQSTPRMEKQVKEKNKAERSTISTGVSLMKRLAAMKKCKSPPPVGVGYSIDNPVFEDTPGVTTSANEHNNRHPVHVRAPTEGPWQTQHRKSQSLDVTATRRDRHHSQPVKERFRCIVPYPPNSEYELELKVDDIVIVSKKRGDGWYKGTLQRTGRTGLFPASFVESCPLQE